MKRRLAILPLVLVAVLSRPQLNAASPSLTPRGTTELTTFLQQAVGRGDVAGVVVAVVDREGAIYDEAAGRSSTVRNSPIAKLARLRRSQALKNTALRARTRGGAFRFSALMSLSTRSFCRRRSI